MKSNRGRKLGQLANPRDERGWMIPRAGTVRRRVYNLLLDDASDAEIAEIVGISQNAAGTHRRMIQFSVRVNAQRWAAAQEQF